MFFFKRKSLDHSLSSATHDPIAFARPAPLHRSEGYLQGQLLVSTPLVTGSCFHQSVIYLFAHTAEGAMGVIINQPLETAHTQSLLDEGDLAAKAISQDIGIYYGGPVDRGRGFVIHTTDYRSEHSLFTTPTLAVSAHASILRDIVAGTGPKQSILCVGYAGWSAGQLEQELEENSWITVPASPDIIFEPDDDLKWSMASRSLGIDMNFYSHSVGHA